MINHNFDNARHIWSRIIKSEDDKPYSFDIEIQKQLLNLFHVGPYYYYIFNCGTADFELVDTKAEEVMGYPLDCISPGFLFV